MTSAMVVIKLYLRRMLVGLALAACLGVTTSAQIEVIQAEDLAQRLKLGGDTTFVVNLWATWCKPCVAELPYFERISREMATVVQTTSQSATPAPPVKVLLVSVDAKRDLTAKVEPFVTKRGITAEVVLMSPVDVDAVDNRWSGAIPATLLVRGSKRGFYEQEFTFVELTDTINSFMKDN